MAGKTQEQALQDAQEDLKKTVDEIGEILAKSGLYKDEEDPNKEPPMPPEGDGAAPEPPPAPPAENEAPPAPPAEDEQPPAPPAEGEQPPADPEAEKAEMAEQAKSFSDEEINMMIEVLQSELSNREGAAPPAAPEPPPAEKSMPEPMAELAKSMSALATSVESLVKSNATMAKEVESLKKSQAAAATARPTARVAAANTRDVQVRERVEPKVEKLSKSQAAKYIEGEIRKGNHKDWSMPGRDAMALVCAAREDTDDPTNSLDNVLARLREEGGIKFPNDK